MLKTTHLQLFPQASACQETPQIVIFKLEENTIFLFCKSFACSALAWLLADNLKKQKSAKALEYVCWVLMRQCRMVQKDAEGCSRVWEGAGGCRGTLLVRYMYTKTAEVKLEVYMYSSS